LDWDRQTIGRSSPPKSGTLKPLEVVGDKNAMVYCDLITQTFVGTTMSDICGQLFIHQNIAIKRLRMSIMYQSKNVPSRI